MKKSVLLVLLVITSYTYSQQIESYSVGIGGGYVQNGYGINVAYDYYYDRNKYVKAEALFSVHNEKFKNESFKSIPYQSFYLNIGQYWEIAGFNRRTYTWNIGGGASVGYQVINKGKEELENGAIILSKSMFVYGVFTGATFKVFLTQDTSLQIEAKEFYHVNSDIGNLSPYISVGMNYIIY